MKRGASASRLDAPHDGGGAASGGRGDGGHGPELGVVGGGEFSITSLILNLLLPGAYVYGAMQMKGNI